jgi:hypothetical protein
MIKDYLNKRKNYKILKDFIKKNINNFSYYKRYKFIKTHGHEGIIESFVDERFCFVYRSNFNEESWNYLVYDLKKGLINLTYSQRKSLFEFLKKKKINS